MKRHLHEEEPVQHFQWAELLPELRGEVRAWLDPFARRLLRLVSKHDATEDAAWHTHCPLGPYSALVEGGDNHWHVAVALWPKAMDCLRATLQRKYQLTLEPADLVTIVGRVHPVLLVEAAVKGDQLALVQDVCLRRPAASRVAALSKALRLGRTACGRWLFAQADNVRHPFRPYGPWFDEATALCSSRELLEVADAYLARHVPRYPWYQSMLAAAARTGMGRAWTAFAYALERGAVVTPGIHDDACESPDPDIRRYAAEHSLSY